MSKQSGDKEGFAHKQLGRRFFAKVISGQVERQHSMNRLDTQHEMMEGQIEGKVHMKESRVPTLIVGMKPLQLRPRHGTKFELGSTLDMI